MKQDEIMTIFTGANRGTGAALLTHYATRGENTISTSYTAQSDLAVLTSQVPPFADTPINLLIYNAGVYPDKTRCWMMAILRKCGPIALLECHRRFLTIQALLPNMRAAKSKIAIISSQMASHEYAHGRGYIYRVSKAAALNLGRNLSVDLASEGIALGIDHPSWGRTDMGGKGGDISLEPRNGPVARFDALPIDSAGCFKTYDG